MLFAFCCCGFCRDASGKSMTRFTLSAGSFQWGNDHPNALARKVKFFFKRGVAQPRQNAWTSDTEKSKILILGDGHWLSYDNSSCSNS